MPEMTIWPSVSVEEAVSDRLCGNVAAPDPYGGGGAAYRVQHQLQKVVYVIVGVLPPQTLVVNIRFQFFSSLVSIYLQSRRWGLSGGDGWIRLDKFCLVSFSIIRVGFFDGCTSIFSTSWRRNFRLLHVGKIDL